MGIRMFRVFVSILLVVSFVSIGFCADLPIITLKTSCQKNRSIEESAGPLNPRQCNMLPCRAGRERIFTLPDSATQIKRENKVELFEDSMPWTKIIFLSYQSQPAIYIAEFHDSGQPPFYLLNCSLSC